jgi:hypothetical protein
MLFTNLSSPSANLEPAGGASGLSLYLPLSRPKLRGENVVNPVPNLAYRRWNSRSTFCLVSMLYIGCSATGAMRPSCFAIPQASAISSELHSLVPQYMAHPFCSITWLNARTVSSMGVRRSGRWAYTISTYSRSRRFKEARRPSMMCLRDRPWLLTSTSPFAPPKIFTKSDYLSWKF